MPGTWVVRNARSYIDFGWQYLYLTSDTRVTAMNFVVSFESWQIMAMFPFNFLSISCLPHFFVNKRATCFVLYVHNRKKIDSVSFIKYEYTFEIYFTSKMISTFWPTDSSLKNTSIATSWKFVSICFSLFFCFIVVGRDRIYGHSYLFLKQWWWPVGLILRHNCVTM